MPSSIEKIHSRTAKVGVIGLGYVGLPLAVEIAPKIKIRTGTKLPCELHSNPR